MTTGDSQTDDRKQLERIVSPAELIDQLSRFDGPPHEFLARLLAVQCSLSKAEAGAILRPGQSGQPEILAVYPPLVQGATAPVWLAQAIESAPGVASALSTAIVPIHGSDDLYGQQARRHLIMIPLKSEQQGARGVATFLVNKDDPREITAATERLELTVSLLSLYEMRLTLQRRQSDLGRLRVGMEVISAINEQTKFAGAAMAMCNEIATNWQCERVALGMLKGRYINLKAMSNTEKFSRKMELVQDLETAMEECIDQDVEVIYPAGKDATYVSRSTGEMSDKYGRQAIVSLPLRKAGEPVAILTAERNGDLPFGGEEIQALRLACDLSTARIVNLYEQDKWIGAKLAGWTKKGMSWIVGSKHTWVKLAIIGVIIALSCLIFLKGDYEAEGSFVFQTIERQIVPAPFDGFIKTVEADPDDKVLAGKTVLAHLDTDELEIQLKRAEADRKKSQLEQQAATRLGRTSEEQAARAALIGADAQIAELKLRIKQATLIAPISGTIVVGELKSFLGSPVQKGQVLFEIAPLDLLQAEVSVLESEIAEVLVDQHGELAATGYPGKKVKFIVERINPVPEPAERKNVFKVRVTLVDGKEEWMKPGMEGVAKIKIGQRSYGWLWTRKLVRWVRMKLWL